MTSWVSPRHTSLVAFVARARGVHGTQPLAAAPVCKNCRDLGSVFFTYTKDGQARHVEVPCLGSVHPY